MTQARSLTIRTWMAAAMALPVAVALVCAALAAHAAPSTALPGDEVTEAQVSRIAGEVARVPGAFPGMLVTTRDRSGISDGRYSQPYRLTVSAYGLLPASADGEPRYVRRFLVYGPDTDALPTVMRVSRLLLLLWSERRAHLGVDHPPDTPTLQVWLTRQVGRGLSADTAGEQFKNQIYLYDLAADRKPAEWAREVAHEYGHFALVPGISGYEAPENDSSGYVGEQLFLTWIEQDALAGRIHSDELPFVTLEDLTGYLNSHARPLADRVESEGADLVRLKARGADAMESYIGLVLAIDQLYGSRRFQDARALSVPADGALLRPADLLHGLAGSLADARSFTITVPAKRAATMALLPAGRFSVRMDSAGVAVRFGGGAPVLPGGLTRLRAGWQRLTLTRAVASESPVRITFDRAQEGSR